MLYVCIAGFYKTECVLSLIKTCLAVVPIVMLGVQLTD